MSHTVYIPINAILFYNPTEKGVSILLEQPCGAILQAPAWGGKSEIRSYKTLKYALLKQANTQCADEQEQYLTKKKHKRKHLILLSRANVSKQSRDERFPAPFDLVPRKKEKENRVPQLEECCCR